MNEYLMYAGSVEFHVKAITRVQAAAKVRKAFEKAELRHSVQSADGDVRAFLGVNRKQVQELQAEAERTAYLLDSMEPPYGKLEIVDDLRAILTIVQDPDTTVVPFDMMYLAMFLSNLTHKVDWYLENVGDN